MSRSSKRGWRTATMTLVALPVVPQLVARVALPLQEVPVGVLEQGPQVLCRALASVSRASQQHAPPFHRQQSYVRSVKPALLMPMLKPC